ncbi:MAG: BrnT family toxin [Mogibacterium sp.]|nr:BrnT family toxin [Mogibacterium sp.]
MLKETTNVEWDEQKNLRNQTIHGIGFDEAALVFGDPFRIEIFDSTHSLDENRYITIGMVRKVLFVVYTMRGDTHRIISARLANAEERKAYYGND